MHLYTVIRKYECARSFPIQMDEARAGFRSRVGGLRGYLSPLWADAKQQQYRFGPEALNPALPSAPSQKAGRQKARRVHRCGGLPEAPASTPAVRRIYPARSARLRLPSVSLRAEPRQAPRPAIRRAPHPALILLGVMRSRGSLESRRRTSAPSGPRGGKPGPHRKRPAPRHRHETGRRTGTLLKTARSGRKERSSQMVLSLEVVISARETGFATQQQKNCPLSRKRNAPAHLSADYFFVKIEID